MSVDRLNPEEDPRVRFAGERTLLAWVRTGLAMMALGFVVARFGLFLHELAPLHPNVTPPASGLSVWLGTALVMLGVVVCLLSAWEHLVFVRRLERGEPYRPARWSMGVVVSVVLAAGGVIVVVYLVTLRP